MARPRRGNAAPLIDRIAREPHRFESSQIVRILDARGAGIRFRASLSLAFPTSDIERVTIPARAAEPAEMLVNFIGLGGAMGPLPTPYTEHLSAAVRRRETAGRDFLDLFNHRVIGAAFELDKLFRPVLQAPLPQESRHAAYHYALLGLRTPAIAETIPALAPSLLPLTALLHERPLSAHAIERMLATVFDVPVRVGQFRGGWLDIPLDQRSAIGLGGRHRALGQSAMLGGRQWDQAAGITIEIGPLPLDRAERLLPPVVDGAPSDHPHLAALLDFATGGGLEICIRLLVEGDTLRSAHAAPTTPMRLGWTSWLHDAAPRAPQRAGIGPRLGRVRLGRDAPMERLGGVAVRTIVLRPAHNAA